MAWDDSKAKLHLTPKGWTTGKRPDDAVETWSRSTQQTSGWSKEYVDWSCTWASPSATRAERDALRAKHKGFMGSPGQAGNRVTSIGAPL
jgi:hypothetical protein